MLRVLKESVLPARPPERLFHARLPGFDEVYYRYWYRDIRGPVDPIQHYLLFGWREGRDPSDGFSTRGYLAANPDVALANINPLLHFLEIGLTEGRGGWYKKPGLPAPTPQQPSDHGVKLLAPPRS